MKHRRGDKVTDGGQGDGTVMLRISVSKDVVYLGLPDTEGTSMELYQARNAPQRDKFPWKGTHDPGHMTYTITRALGTVALFKPAAYVTGPLVMAWHLPMEAMPQLLGHWMPQVRDAALARLAGAPRGFGPHTVGGPIP